MSEIHFPGRRRRPYFAIGNISMETPMKSIGAFVLAAVALAAPSAAFAQTHSYPAPAPGYYPYDPCEPGYSAQSQDRAAYDCSGTRGRIGLGASPFHPEGPGNVTITR
jgi:hypothetical protein